MEGTGCAGLEEPDDGDGDNREQLRGSHKYAIVRMTKMMHNRAGAPRWTQKLCRIPKTWLADDSEEGLHTEEMVQYGG